MENFKYLLDVAWTVREKAQPWKSGTKVGCAIEAETGQTVYGWNIEGLWMTSIHAEVVAVSQLAPLQSKGIAIAIVADTAYFTPCGACVDWLIQFCKPDALVIIQNKEQTWQYQLKDLMPYYPKRQHGSY